jgi:hypothetical protein
MEGNGFWDVMSCSLVEVSEERDVSIFRIEE